MHCYTTSWDLTRTPPIGAAWRIAAEDIRSVGTLR